jgi:hypothetical protein
MGSSDALEQLRESERDDGEAGRDGQEEEVGHVES